MSTNDCQWVQPQLSAYHDAELSAAQSEAIAKHVKSCAACSSELSAIESLGAIFDQAPVPAKPADLWQRIQHQIPTAAEPVSLFRTFGFWIRESPYAASLISMAASVLLLLGVGFFYRGQSRVKEVDMGSGGAVAMHTHDGEMSADHMAEFAGVMNDYLQKLPVDPDAAEQVLLSKYNGQNVDSDGALKLVGYRPIISGGLPDGYSLASTSVLKMPCCTCVKTVCKRNDGSTLVLFEHDDDETAWFGDRPSTMAMCGDKDCCLVDLDSSIAATWKQGTRSVTAVGVRDQAEVATLVNWIGKKI